MKLSLLLCCIPALSAHAITLPVVVSKTGKVRTETIAVRNLDRGNQYSLLYSLDSLSALQPATRVGVEVRQGAVVLASKVLHAGDADLYSQFRVPHAGNAVIAITATPVSSSYRLQVNRWPLNPRVKSAPSHRWQDASPIALNSTVFAYGDDSEYIALPGTSRKAKVEDPERFDWYRLEFSDPKPRLVFFQLELTERDQLPVDVSVFRQANGKPEEYYDGEDPVTLPHEVQALPGNKFTPRVLRESGTYYVRVRANHPEYKLRTRVYNVPPYDDPREAVRTGLDYILAAGDSWHANTPRRGGVLDRVETPHQETSLCVGCHTTHFPQRAQLYATRNGYPVVQRQQLQFLAERFYNNPRPFYGFERQGAVWARVISAPANVLGRMSHLMDVFEDQVSLETRPAFHKGIVEYLNLYYAGRDKLPADETNGNTPLVSAHEVAWYAWTATKDARLPDLIARGEVKNTIDLCYQTLALADMDRAKYREQIQANAMRILSLQRPDGQWSARFEAEQPEVEFQTGHALWALQAAGVPVTSPQVAKAIAWLIKRQQAFGGWMDPLQSFENFRTPFRETQMAAVALSTYFPIPGRARGWNSPGLEALSTDPVRLLDQLDSLWDQPADSVKRQLVAASQSNDALIRQAAVEVLGRLGMAQACLPLLGDASKMVQRTAAWAVRQGYSRHADLNSSELLNALASDDDRRRWGATRVFAQHFSTLAQRPEIAAALGKLTSDSAVTVRMQAIKGLWQFWFWTPGPETKSKIEDTLLAASSRPQEPWVGVNLREAICNIADENIRYLYNNWVPLLAQPQDREQAVRGRLAVEDRLATKFSQVLETGPPEQKKFLLSALVDLPLRRGDIYDLESDLTKDAPPIYNRIGNDIEQIAFFGQSAERFAKALNPLLNSNDVEMRRLATRAVLLVRDVNFADVNRIAGASGASVKLVQDRVAAMPEAADVTRALHPTPPAAAPASGAGGAPAPRVKLDEAFFRGYVEPILQKRGRDGYACVHCHATHTLFNATFSTVANVVNQADPESSLILRKPTSTAETEGIVNSNVTAHGGGVRFTKDSPEYATILQWIKGAKE